jgi:hypothetical protein
MGKIILTDEELGHILISNKLLPKEILHPKFEGDRIRFAVKTNLPFVQFIPVSLKYLSFNDKNAIFELTVVNSGFSKIISQLNLFSKIDVPASVKLDFPRVFVDVNELLKEMNIKGIQLDDVIFDDGKFTLMTCCD